MTQIETSKAHTTVFKPTVYIAVYNHSNPGRTSWSAVWLDESGRLQQFGDVVENCTNMRAELIAATAALRAFQAKTHVKVVCTSQYLLNYHQNLPSWKQRDWRGSNGKPVKNSDDWFELDKLACRREVSFTTENNDPRSLASYARQVAVSALSCGSN